MSYHAMVMYTTGGKKRRTAVLLKIRTGYNMYNVKA